MDLQWFESGEMPPEDLDSLSRNLAFHLKRLVDERDTHLEVMTFTSAKVRVRVRAQNRNVMEKGKYAGLAISRKKN